MGTISAMTQKKDCWKATATPIKTSAAIRVLTLLAVAPIMLPIRARPEPKIKNLSWFWVR